MRTLLILALVSVAGCHVLSCGAPLDVENQVKAVAPAKAVPENPPCVPDPAAAPPPPLTPCGPPDLPTLWDLALVSNPSLREAAADVEAARGRLIQAGKYPNPRFLYDQDTIGSKIAREGNMLFQVNQEVVTAGKLRLDQSVARKETDAAAVALLGRKFEVLTRVRRAFFDYLAWGSIVRVNDDVVADLERGVEVTRDKVEKAKTSPVTELLRLQALLGEAKVGQTRSRLNRQAAWQQLAAEVGVDELPFAEATLELPPLAPRWDGQAVRARVLSANTAVKEAQLDAARARLALERARAEAVPNVTVGAGYDLDNVDQTRGGVFAVEAPLPLWDRKQGHVHEAAANWAKAEAAVRSASTRLSRDVAEAWARYEAARREVERLEEEVLPRLRETIELMRKGYEAGAPNVSFNDLILTVQSFNTSRLSLAEARRTLWLAVADLQGLMQLDVGEELSCLPPPSPTPCRWLPTQPCDTKPQ